ncbi:Lipopolysaccharide ABC transporter, ATP-binding protein LptB [hydrothermal vent metagenome]|uniref:Lipopolysaccharide export system ATP-binding protein LptB n=1 Tax=hydrothermal vent metagenome TaxID=652676 RepID=A0A3B0TB19_9ZZZZ
MARNFSFQNTLRKYLRIDLGWRRAVKPAFDRNNSPGPVPERRFQGFPSAWLPKWNSSAKPAPATASAAPQTVGLTQETQPSPKRRQSWFRRKTKTAAPKAEPQTRARPAPRRRKDTPPAAEQQDPRRERAKRQSVSGLAAHGLVKSYGGRPVVRGASIALDRGEAVGLLGPNGAGKTTAFYMMIGLVQADDGRIELDGFDITGLPMYRRARLGIGYLPQEASIFRGLTVEQNINAVLELVEPNRDKRAAKLDSLLDEFGITRLRTAPAISLSGGERRRVEIARALASEPSFMLLDEPFAGVDPIAVGDIRAIVRHLTRRGIGVLVTDHNVRETLELIDRAYIIHDGKMLMEGTPKDIVRDADVRRVYLGEQFTY